MTTKPQIGAGVVGIRKKCAEPGRSGVWKRLPSLTASRPSCRKYPMSEPAM